MLVFERRHLFQKFIIYPLCPLFLGFFIIFYFLLLKFIQVLSAVISVFFGLSLETYSIRKTTSAEAHRHISHRQIRINKAQKFAYFVLFLVNFNQFLKFFTKNFRGNFFAFRKDQSAIIYR